MLNQALRRNPASSEGVGTHGASAARATRYLLLVLAAILAGCGSSDPAGSYSMKGVEAGAHEFVADVKAELYGEACEALTAAARASLAKAPQGCPGTLLLAKPFLVKQLVAQFNSIHRDGQITNDTVLYGGSVQARYEHDRWHFENDVW